MVIRAEFGQWSGRMNERTSNRAVFHSELQRAIGKKIWDYAQGAVNGPAFSLQLGEKRAIEYGPEKLAKLTAYLGREPIQLEGEFSFFVEGHWRLECPDRSVTCEDDVEFGGPIDHGLSELIGRRITSISLAAENDLVIDIEGGYRLELLGGGEPLEVSYSFFTVNRTFCVLGSGRLSIDG